jgi:hypothetical protein
MTTLHRATCGRDGAACPTNEHGFCSGCRDEVPVTAPAAAHDEGCPVAVPAAEVELVWCENIEHHGARGVFTAHLSTRDCVHPHGTGRHAPATDPRTAPVTRTRVAIGTQIAEACAALDITFTFGTRHGLMVYVVNGEKFSAGEMADRVLEGGFAAAYGASETRPVATNPFTPQGT